MEVVGWAKIGSRMEELSRGKALQNIQPAENKDLLESCRRPGKNPLLPTDDQKRPKKFFDLLHSIENKATFAESETAFICTIVELKFFIKREVLGVVIFFHLYHRGIEIQGRFFISAYNIYQP